MDSRRGLVLEIKKGRATLLCPGGEFRAAAVPDGAHWVVGQEVRLDHSMAARGAWRNWLSARPAVAALALLVALVAVGMPVAGRIYNRPLATVAYLSVDINPSFEVGMDARGRTSSVTALNDDAAKLIQGRSFSGPVHKVVSQLVEMAVDAGYLGTPDGLVIITTSPAPSATVSAQTTQTRVATPETAVAEKALADTKASVEATLAKANKTNAVQGLKVDAETREEAHNEGLSQGKFAILLAAQGENLRVSVDDLKSGSVTQAIKNAGGQVGEVVGKAAQVKDFHPLVQEFRDRSEKDKDKGQDKDQDKSKDASGNKDKGSQGTVPAQGKDAGKSPKPAGSTKPEGDEDKDKGSNPGGETPGKGSTVGMSGGQSGSPTTPAGPTRPPEVSSAPGTGTKTGAPPGKPPNVAPGLPGVGPPAGRGQAVGDGRWDQGESRAGRSGYAPLPETRPGVGDTTEGSGSKAKEKWISSGPAKGTKPGKDTGNVGKENDRTKSDRPDSRKEDNKKEDRGQGKGH